MSRGLGFVCALGLLLAPGLALASSPVDAVEADRARIQDHLRRVELELRAVDTSSWPAQRREARARMIDTLHAYRERGVFPRNANHPGITHPYFIDAQGRACAVAHLMIESGAVELAHAMQRDHGVDYVADMRTPGISAWAEGAGLSVAELAAIQPGYCSCGSERDPVCGVNGVTYWNECVAGVCGDVEIDYAGACSDPEISCEPPHVTMCGAVISDGVCSPEDGGEVVWEYEAIAWLEDPVCDDDLKPRGCDCNTDAPPPISGGLALGLLLLGAAWRRERMIFGD